MGERAGGVGRQPTLDADATIPAKQPVYSYLHPIVQYFFIPSVLSCANKYFLNPGNKFNLVRLIFAHLLKRAKEGI